MTDNEASSSASAAGALDSTQNVDRNILSPEFDLRLKHAIKLDLEEKKHAEAAELLSELTKASVAKYGELAPAIAPIYYAYGDVLLNNVEMDCNPLGSPDAEVAASDESASGAAVAISSSGSGAGAGAAEGDEDEDDEEEGAGAASSAAADAEEDITGADGDGDEAPTDLEIAWECLDVARVIYGKMEGTEAALFKAKALLRLGDCHMESDRFQDALVEYKECLAIRSQLLPKWDRALADVLIQMMVAYMQLASEAEVTDLERKQYLAHAQVLSQGAAEVLVEAADRAAAAAGNEEFRAALRAEIEAGAITRVYPPGVTTTCVGMVPGTSYGAGAGAGSSSSSSSSSSSDALGEPEVRVFMTLYERYGAPGVAAEVKVEDAAAEAVLSSSSASPVETSSSSSSAAAAPAPKPTKLDQVCDQLDQLVQRRNDIEADLGVSVETIVQQVAGNDGESADKGVTTIGFGQSPSAGVGASSPAAPANVIAVTSMLLTKRKSVTAVASDASSSPAGASSSSGGAKRGLEETAATSDAADAEGEASKRVKSE